MQRVVHSDPEILGGTPVFMGTRVPVKNLIDYLEAGVPGRTLSSAFAPRTSGLPPDLLLVDHPVCDGRESALEPRRDPSTAC
jgi:Protein of unknown function (DUF433)